MPRTGQSKVGAIVAFFRSAPMEVATLIYGLAGDEIRERKAKGEKIREAQQTAAKQRGKGKKPTTTAGASTASVAADAATGSVGKAAAPAKVRKKPGPPKGFKRGQKKGPRAVAAAADVGQGQANAADESALPLLEEGDIPVAEEIIAEQEQALLAEQ